MNSGPVEVGIGDTIRTEYGDMIVADTEGHNFDPQNAHLDTITVEDGEGQKDGIEAVLDGITKAVGYCEDSGAIVRLSESMGVEHV